MNGGPGSDAGGAVGVGAAAVHGHGQYHHVEAYGALVRSGGRRGVEGLGSGAVFPQVVERGVVERGVGGGARRDDYDPVGVRAFFVFVCFVLQARDA